MLDIKYIDFSGSGNTKTVSSFYLDRPNAMLTLYYSGASHDVSLKKVHNFFRISGSNELPVATRLVYDSISGSNYIDYLMADFEYTHPSTGSYNNDILHIRYFANNSQSYETNYYGTYGWTVYKC